MESTNTKSTENQELDHIQRRCLIIKSSGDITEQLVDLQDKESLLKLFNYELVFLGEIGDSHICVLGGESEKLPENEVDFELTPHRDHIYGDLLVFITNEDGQPVDLTESKFKRVIKKLHKQQSKLSSTNTNDKDNEMNSESNNNDTKQVEGTDLFLNGLPYQLEDEDILKFFSNIRDKISDIRIHRYHDSNNCRGYAHIRVANEALQQALAKDGEYIGNRYVSISKANTKKANNDMTIKPVDTEVPAGCKTIFIKNLPYESSEEDVENALKVFGPIESVRIPRWTQTGNTKGFAYLSYVREDSVIQACKKSGSISINNRPIIIRYDVGQPKASFRDKDGQYWNKTHEEPKKNQRSQSARPKSKNN